MGQSHSADAADISIRRCSPTTSSELLIQGEIRKGDATRFIRMADELGKDTNCPMLGSMPNVVPFIFVKLDSSGGDIIEALAIGREVRRRFMLTGVVRNMECDSACVFILAPGSSELVMARSVFIALHSIQLSLRAFLQPPRATATIHCSRICASIMSMRWAVRQKPSG